jgi:UDP-N-acetylmuramyl pentapeptide phosphotransferase/UDP-N-acetylglucosamine-1-phosphate transferase
LWQGGHVDSTGAVGVIVVATAIVCCLATRSLIPLLRRRNVLDRPNQRSSHVVPTPRGGGIAVIWTVLLAWLGVSAAGWVSSAIIAVTIAAALLAVVCWVDDLRGLAPATRLSAQAAAVAVGLLALPEPANGLWVWLGPVSCYVAVGFVWLWWINLFNFMDGIDGIASSEAAAIGGGLVLVALFGKGADFSVALLSAAILGASLGFLVWNWSPARIFLGDVGSVPLGYVTGFLLIGLAGAGRWKVALILPLYFLPTRRLPWGAACSVAKGCGRLTASISISRR